MDTPDKAAEIKAAAAALIALGTALFGWVGWMVVLWLIAMALDYLTGTFAALYNKTWSSAAARRGLWHKLGSISACWLPQCAILCSGSWAITSALSCR